MTRRGIRTLAALAVAVLATFGLAQPASAIPYWQPVHMDGSWHCTNTFTTADPGMTYRGCTVVTGHYAQLVLVVSNNDTSTHAIGGFIRRGSTEWDCWSSAMSAGQQRGCFGPTQHLTCGVAFYGDVYFSGDSDVYKTETPHRSAC